MRPLLRYLPHVLVIAFAVWCAYALRGDLAQVSLVPVLHAWDLFILAAALSLLNYLLRIIRWRSYLARLGHPLGFRFAALTYVAGFAYTLSPGKVGEMVRARYYLPHGIPLPRTAAAFFAERLLDLIAMVILAALLFAASHEYRAAIGFAAVLVVGVLVVCTVMPWERVSNQVKKLEKLPPLLRKGLLGVTAALVSTRPLLKPGPLLFGFAIGLVAWGLEGVGLKVLAGMIPTAPVALATAVGIYAVAVLVGGLSFLPGGLGGTEAIMTTLLATHGFSIPEAILVTLTCRLVTLWLAVCLGWIAVMVLPKQSFAAATP
jgi:glycosyltransferase 2 family protein